MSVSSLGSSTIDTSQAHKNDDSVASFDLNAAAAFEKFSYRLLDLSYALSLESFLPYWFVMFSMGVEFMQQLNVIFPNDGSPPSIPWGLPYTDWIRSWTHVASKGILASLFGSSSSVAAIGLVLILYAGAGAISFVLSRGDVPNLVLIRAVSIAAKLMTTILYIPVLSLLVQLTSSNSLALSMCGVFFAVLHFCAAALTTVAINDIQMLSQDPTARIHCRFQFTSLLFNTMLVVAAALLQNMLGFFVLLNAVFSFYVAVAYTKYCPFNAEALNYMQSGLSWTFAWSMTAALVSVIQNDSGTSGPTFIVFGGAPIVFAAGALASQMKMKALLVRPDIDLGDPFEIERKVRLILRQGFRTSLIDQSNISKKLDDDSDDQVESTSLVRARRILIHSMVMYPDASLLPLLAGLLYFNFFRVNFVGYEFLRKAEQIGPAFDMRVLLFRLQRDNERKILLDEANHDVVEFNEYNELLTKAQDYDLSLTKALVSFWDELSEQTPDIKLLRSLSVTVSQDSVQALTLYQRALKIHGDSVFVLKTYAGLLSSLLQDSTESNRLLARAKEIEIRKKSSSGRKEDSFRNVLFSDHSSVVVISGSGNNLGRILNVNAFAPQMFGIPESSLIGANVNILMPEPFSSLHDIILRRNLQSGKNFVVNQRRSVPILHHSGYIVDAILHVKLFIRDLTNLCFIGVFEVINEEHIQLIIDSQGIVRSISFTAVQQFGVSQSRINSNRYSIECLLTDYAVKRSAIISNKSRDRQWTEIIQVIGDIRYRLNISLDVHWFPGDTFVDMLRIGIIESEPASNPDRWTSTSVNLDDRIGSLPSVRRRIVNNKTESVTDSSVFDQETARKTGDNRSRQTGSAPAYSESSRSSGASSSQQYEIAKRRDQITVSWLKRSIQVCLILISMLTFSSYLFTNSLGDSFMALIDEQKLGVERELQLVTIALVSTKLQLLREGLITVQTEDDLKSQLHRASNSLYRINQQQISEWRSTSDLAELYVSPLSNSTSSSLQDAMAALSSKAEQIRQLPLANIDDQNDLVKFVDAIILQVLDKIIVILRIVDQIIANALSEHRLLLLMVAVISFILVATLCMYELRPAVDNIFMHSTLVFLRFFDIPPECIGTSLEPLVNRLKSLSQAGDQTTIGSVGLMSLEAKIAFGENEAVKRATKAKAERARHNRIRNVVLSNQRKMVQDSGLISKVFVIIFIYLAYFSIDTGLKVHFTSEQELFHHQIQGSRQLHTLQRRALLVLTEYIQDPDKYPYEYVQAQITEPFSKFDRILFGDDETNDPGIYSDSAYNQILFGDLCGIISAKDCKTFASGSSTLGLQMLMAVFRTTLSEELLSFQLGYKSLPDPQSISALSTLTRSTLQSSAFHQLWRLDNEFLFPTLSRLSQMRLQIVDDESNLIGNVSLILLFALFTTNIAIYSMFCVPFLQRLVREFEHCRVLLRLIPNTLRAVKINNDDDEIAESGIHGTEIAPSEQRMEQSTGAQRRPIFMLKLRRAVVAIYGCASRRRNLALGVITAASLALWSRFFNFSTAREVYAKEYPTAVVVAIGAFLSTSTATASMPLGPAFYAVFHGHASFTLSEIMLFGTFTELIARSVAVLFLISIGYTIDWKLVVLGSISSMIGSTAGHLLRYEDMLISYEVTLLCISSLMCAIGLAIAICTTAFGDSAFTSLNFDSSVKVDVIVVAICGGLINSLVGFGLTAILFGLSTLYFRLNSQIATSTAISIGCMNSIFNVIVNFTISKGLRSRILPLLLAFWPFVVFGASIGTYMFSRMHSAAVRNSFFLALTARFFIVIILYRASSTVFFFIMGSSLVMITAMFVILGVGGYIRTVSTSNQ